MATLQYRHFPVPAFSSTGIFQYRHFPVPSFSSTVIFQYRHFPVLAFSSTGICSTGIFQRPKRAYILSFFSKLFPRSSPNPNACTYEKSKSARTLIHKSQRFRNKADDLYLTTPNLPFVCFLSVFLHLVLAIKNNLPVYLMIPCNYCTNPEPVAQIMKYKVSRALHAVTRYYTCMKLPYVLYLCRLHVCLIVE